MIFKLIWHIGYLNGIYVSLRFSCHELSRVFIRIIYFHGKNMIYKNSKFHYVIILICYYSKSKISTEKIKLILIDLFYYE